MIKIKIKNKDLKFGILIFLIHYVPNLDNGHIYEWQINIY